MLRIVFPIVALIGLFLLTRSIRKLVQVYTGYQQEFRAQDTSFQFSLDQPAVYEIAVKRRSVTGVIPGAKFELLQLPAREMIAVQHSVGIFSGRKDMEGNRIVPVATFRIVHTGRYELINTDHARFTSQDTLIIAPKPGVKGALVILATVCSALLMVGGIVFAILTFRNKI